jgi:hypothetical protein
MTLDFLTPESRSDGLVIASYGGGTNSTAMLIGCAEKRIKVDLILFADTGGEKPHTYAYVDLFSDWLEQNGMPRVVTVEQQISLEQDCLTRGALPGVAYGFKSCSDRWKIRPQNNYIKENGLTIGTKLIGFDAGEPQRAKEIEGNRYPLIEWDWDRDDCIAAIERAGLPLPGKSSCFFCPNSKKSEIREMAVQYPDLAARALKMEAGAELTHIAGLGRTFSWDALLATGDMFEDEYDVAPEMPCGCYDGD